MLKKCTKCEEVKLATSEYFQKDKSKKDGLRPDCKVCAHEYGQDNKEAIAERVRRWREANPEDSQEYNREYGPRYYRANKERIADVKRQYIKANPEKRAVIDRRYHEAHPKRLQERKRRWLEANPEKRREWDRRKRAKRAGVEGSHTEAEWQALCSYYMDQCLCCGEVPDKLTRDHVIPITKGGSNDIGNIQPLCKSCNSKKYLKTTDYRIDYK